MATALREELTQKEIFAIAKRGLADPVFFCEFFLKDWFPTTMPWMHRGALAILTRQTSFLKGYEHLDKIISNFVYTNPEDPQKREHPIFVLQKDGTIQLQVGKYVLIKWPRGFSKTTLLNAVSVMSIAYILYKYLVYISETARHSEKQLGTVKRVFERNEMINLVFGNLVPDKASVFKYTANYAEFLNGVKFGAVGRGGQIRGANSDATRPELVLVDDVEDEKSVKSDEQRADTLHWFTEAVMPILPSPKFCPNASIFMAGTLLHRNALMQVLELDPAWTSLSFGAYDKQGDLLWPAHMGEKELAARKKSFAIYGNLAGYYREYESKLRNEETAKFKLSYIKHVNVPDDEFVVKAMAIDPAISDNPKADLCAFGVVGMTRLGRISILDVLGDVGVPPDEQIEMYFMLSKKWNVTPAFHGVESIAYQRALIHLLESEMYARNHYFEVIPITHGIQAKNDRIEGILQPRYAAGYITHRRAFTEYEDALLDWPHCRYKDLLDVIAMAISLLDNFAAYSAVGTPHDPIKESLKPLVAINGGRNWRHCP